MFLGFWVFIGQSWKMLKLNIGNEKETVLYQNIYIIHSTDDISLWTHSYTLPQTLGPRLWYDMTQSPVTASVQSSRPLTTARARGHHSTWWMEAKKSTIYTMKQGCSNYQSVQAI